MSARNAENSRSKTRDPLHQRRQRLAERIRKIEGYRDECRAVAKRIRDQAKRIRGS